MVRIILLLALRSPGVLGWAPLVGPDRPKQKDPPGMGGLRDESELVALVDNDGVRPDWLGARYWIISPRVVRVVTGSPCHPTARSRSGVHIPGLEPLGSVRPRGLPRRASPGARPAQKGVT